MTLLYRHAWSRRETLGLNALERLVTRGAMLHWVTYPAVSVVSLALSALLLRQGVTNNLLMSAPGFIFFSVNAVHFFMNRRFRRERAKLTVTMTNIDEMA